MHLYKKSKPNFVVPLKVIQMIQLSTLSAKQLNHYEIKVHFTLSLASYHLTINQLKCHKHVLPIKQIIHHHLFLHNPTMLAIGNAIRGDHRQMDGLFGSQHAFQSFYPVS